MEGEEGALRGGEDRKEVMREDKRKRSSYREEEEQSKDEGKEKDNGNIKEPGSLQLRKLKVVR